jgi:hypothetical protein
MLDPSLLVFDARRGAGVNPTLNDSSSNKLAESYDVVPYKATLVDPRLSQYE